MAIPYGNVLHCDAVGDCHVALRAPRNDRKIGRFLIMKRGLVLHYCREDLKEELLAAVEGLCVLEFRGEDWSSERYQEALKNADFILGEPRNSDFAFCGKLQWMQIPSSGVNYYVGGGCFPEGAVLCNMTGGYGNILAEHMIGMGLSLCRRLPEYQQLQKSGTWEKLYYDKQLEGSTLLILGAGDIGTTIAKWMRPMVGKVIGVRRIPREKPECYDEMVTLEDLERMLPEADIIMCALPETPMTKGLLDYRKLSLTKKDCVLVNGGRGSLIDQEGLYQLLKEGHFWGVGLEVTAPEPLPKDSPLWRAPRLMITPHVAGNTFAPGSAMDRKVWKFLRENTVRYLTGKEPENIVDFDTGYRRFANGN